MKKTTHLYILREIFPIFLIGLMTFTVILLMDKILKLIELIVTRGVNPSQILMLLLFISPSFLIFTIPMAFLLATLLSFGRLSGDSEITAFKASGMSLYQLYLPVLLFSIGTYLLTTSLVIYGLPWGNRGFKATLYLMAQSKADIEIKERVFNDDFDGFVIYVEKVPVRGKKMEGILINDERDKERINTIFAREGFLVSDSKSQEVVLRLLNGDIHRFEPRANIYQKMRFDTYDLRLELAKTFAAVGKKLRDHEMSIEDIKEKMEKKRLSGQDITPQEVELHKRYAIPFSCLVFGLIGVSLGIQPRRSGRSYGFVLSLLILLTYYISLTASEILAIRKTFPPFLAGWAPNILFGSLGIYLLIKASTESPFKPLAWLTELLDFIQRKWKGLFEDV
ncbi:MAG: LPS export ABC transporter permease LptF [Deltaproteobacteria bacterium RBG_16_49_23]|nr:MAG: LPS export ABC transporter permease LptF [Deltaproteobacteria bacterium RBG_16_49_23]